MQRIKHINNDKGVVMLETIITLPLYFILLFGLFVLGDYCLIRLKLNNSERVRHWKMGLRHPVSNIRDNDLFMIFGGDFPEMVGTSRGLVAANRDITSSSLTWGQQVVSAWGTTVAPSRWAADGSKFIINDLWAFLNRTDEPYGSITNRFMYARTRSVNSNDVPIPTATISRLAINNRNATYQGNWFGIFSENYDPNGYAPIVLSDGNEIIYGAKNVNRYGNRNDAYVDWSE